MLAKVWAEDEQVSTGEPKGALQEHVCGLLSQLGS